MFFLLGLQKLTRSKSQNLPISFMQILFVLKPIQIYLYFILINKLHELPRLCEPRNTFMTIHSIILLIRIVIVHENTLPSGLYEGL